MFWKPLGGKRGNLEGYRETSFITKRFFPQFFKLYLEEAFKGTPFGENLGNQ